MLRNASMELLIQDILVYLGVALYGVIMVGGSLALLIYEVRRAMRT